MSFYKPFSDLKLSSAKEKHGDGPPLWAVNKPLPNFFEIEQKGASIMGILNLMRRKNGLEIPFCTIRGIRGSCEAWFGYLFERKKLEPYEKEISYPEGTLFFEGEKKVILYNVEPRLTTYICRKEEWLV